MDEYSKSGPQSPKAAAAERARKMASQMRDLLAYGDEATLVAALKSKYGISPRDPKFEAILSIWREEQQRRMR
jgi:hypothetical protein